MIIAVTVVVPLPLRLPATMTTAIICITHDLFRSLVMFCFFLFFFSDLLIQVLFAQFTTTTELMNHVLEHQETKNDNFVIDIRDKHTLQ